MYVHGDSRVDKKHSVAKLVGGKKKKKRRKRQHLMSQKMTRRAGSDRSHLAFPSVLLSIGDHVINEMILFPQTGSFR